MTKVIFIHFTYVKKTDNCQKKLSEQKKILLLQKSLKEYELQILYIHIYKFVFSRF